MSVAAKEPSELLRSARRSLEGLPRTRILGDLQWFLAPKVWALPIRLEAASASSALIPPTTDWFVVVEDRYPWGAIEIYPAKVGGIATTFPHQDHNGPGDKQLPWRAGDICVRSAGFTLGRRGDDPDPKGDPDRITWYVQRALAWLDKAACGELLKDGDPFELPQWKASGFTVGFVEDGSTFAQWNLAGSRHGIVELVPIGNALAARAFQTLQKQTIVQPSWGRVVSEPAAAMLAGWIRLDRVPVLPPYAAPMRWCELTRLMTEQGLRHEVVMRELLDRIRPSPKRVLLIGFPVPQTTGESASRMHWQPLLLKDVASGKSNGFREKPSAHWQRDLAVALAPNSQIDWLHGRNWAEPELSRRGQLGGQLTSRRVLLIGAGALGSMMAEMLARGGVRHFHILDGEVINAGNLVRHTLTMESDGRFKARELADRLNLLSPHMHAYGHECVYPGVPEDVDVSVCDLVLDCSGSDDVLAALAERRFEHEVDFVSVSVGRGAHRGYLFTCRAKQLPVEAFHAAVAPWLARDRAEFEGREFEWEGTGCWHPVFPARADQLWAFAAAAVRRLDRAANAGEPVLTVLRSDGQDQDGVER